MIKRKYKELQSQIIELTKKIKDMQFILMEQIKVIMDTLSEIECKGEILFVLIEPTQDFISKLGNFLAIDNTVTLEGGFASWQASQYPCAQMSL